MPMPPMPLAHALSLFTVIPVQLEGLFQGTLASPIKGRILLLHDDLVMV